MNSRQRRIKKRRTVIERVARLAVPPAIDGIPSITYGPWEGCEDMPGIKAGRKVFINFNARS